MSYIDDDIEEGIGESRTIEDFLSSDHSVENFHQNHVSNGPALRFKIENETEEVQPRIHSVSKQSLATNTEISQNLMRNHVEDEAEDENENCEENLTVKRNARLRRINSIQSQLERTVSLRRCQTIKSFKSLKANPKEKRATKTLAIVLGEKIFLLIFSTSNLKKVCFQPLKLFKVTKECRVRTVINVP